MHESSNSPNKLKKCAFVYCILKKSNIFRIYFFSKLKKLVTFLSSNPLLMLHLLWARPAWNWPKHRNRFVKVHAKRVVSSFKVEGLEAPDFQPQIKESIWSLHREKYLIPLPLIKVYLFSSKTKKNIFTTGKKQDFEFSMLFVLICSRL